MAKLTLKNDAKQLRVNGMSIKQIANKLGVSSSSVSIWVRSVHISNEGKIKIAQRIIAARMKAAQTLRNNKILRSQKDTETAFKLAGHTNFLSGDKFLIAALVYECEGGKSPKSSLEFTNSDPLLVRIFLKLLRESFTLDESKFRVVMHLHSYHDEKREREFWSKTTGISQKLFLKTYKKNESGNVKQGYRGCVQIKYFDVTIKRTLLAGKALLAEKLGL